MPQDVSQYHQKPTLPWPYTHLTAAFSKKVQKPENRYLQLPEQLLPTYHQVLELTNNPPQPNLTTKNFALLWLLNVIWFLHYHGLIYLEQLIIYCILTTVDVASNMPVKLEYNCSGANDKYTLLILKSILYMKHRYYLIEFLGYYVMVRCENSEAAYKLFHNRATNVIDGGVFVERCISCIFRVQYSSTDFNPTSHIFE